MDHGCPGGQDTRRIKWLRDTSEDDADTLAFVDRRLKDVGRIGRLRGRVEARLGRWGMA